jgi:hypothetical protein
MATNGTVSGSDRQWAKASALLKDPQDEAILQGVRRRRRRMSWLFGTVVAVTVVVGVLAGFLIAAGDDDASDALSSSGPLWLSIVGVAFDVAGLLIIVTYVVMARRAGLFTPGPLSVLSWSQRRSLGRQVLGKEPVQPVRLPLLRHVAYRIMQQRNLLLVSVSGLMLGQLGSFLGSPGLWRAVVLVALACLFLFAGLQLQREGRRAERFLIEHLQLP